MLGLFSHNFTSPWIKADQDIWTLLEQTGTPKIFAANASIYLQGDHSTSFFYLKTGRVKVFLTSLDGAEKTLSIHEPGSLFGETSAFDGLPRLASAKTMIESQVICLNPELLLTFFRVKPEIASNMLQSLTHKIRLLSMQVESMAFLEADKKVANLLLRLASDFGIRTADGIKLSVRCTHEDIANLVGTCRVTVTRVLNAFVKKGLIQKKYGRITISNLDQLIMYAAAFREKKAGHQ